MSSKKKKKKEAEPQESGATRILLERFKNAVKEADEALSSEQHQQAMALYYDASLSADEMCERFLTLLIKTSPNSSYRTLLIEVLSWRLRYLTAQYDYHLAVAMTLTGLPREEWIARLETLLVLSQTWVDKLLPTLKTVDDVALQQRIREVLQDWMSGIRNLVANLRTWGMASAQASRVLEWAIDNDVDALHKE
ncbi:MAG: hypothetical protein ACFE7R_05710 [Candidatus Hodarchaeota archaeon]